MEVMQRMGQIAVVVLMSPLPFAAFACSMPRPEEYLGPATLRKRMVAEQIKARGIRDERVLRAMERVPRHEFVPDHLQTVAYRDHAIAIDHGQSISQPYVVALMTELLELKPNSVVLEVGTGSGYQAAILAEIAARVFSVERIPQLADSARCRLERLGYRHVSVRTGDGYEGWPEAAPFDAIIVTCGGDHVPEPLLQQLKPGGTLVMPVGPTTDCQTLWLIEKDHKGRLSKHKKGNVRFVPLRRGD